MEFLIGNTFYFDWEVRLMEWMQAHLGPVGETLAGIASFLGEQTIMVLILGFLYWCWDKEYGKFVGLNIFAVSVWNPMLKNICVRRRPYMDHSSLMCLRPVEPGADLMDVNAQGYSFPSGHSSSAAAVYGSLAAYQKRGTKARRILTVLAVILILAVGVSRLCVGVHYPTDVLCGWLLGLLAVLVVPMLRRVIKKDWIFYGLLILTSLPGFFYCTSTDYYTGFGMLLGMCAGIPFEEKVVRFENTRVWWKMLLRLAGGGVIYFGLNELLKLPFDAEFLAMNSFLPHLIRTLRYAIIVFVITGVYPMAFSREKKE